MVNVTEEEKYSSAPYLQPFQREKW